MKKADCLLFPSKYEGQGLVLLEALTLGTYCIGSNIPVIAEILKPGLGECAELTVEDFSKAIINFLEIRKNLLVLMRIFMLKTQWIVFINF